MAVTDLILKALTPNNVLYYVPLYDAVSPGIEYISVTYKNVSYYALCSEEKTQETTGVKVYKKKSNKEYFLIGSTIKGRYKVKVNTNEHATILLENQEVSEIEAEREKNISIAVIPEDGYQVDEVMANGVSLNKPYSVTLLDDYVISVAVSKIKYCVTVQPISNGYIRINNEWIEERRQYEHGDELTVEVVPNEGYKFVSLVVNSEAQENGHKFTVYEDTVLIATTTIMLFGLLVEQPEHGAITVNGLPGTSHMFPYGTELDVLLTSETGYRPDGLFLNYALISNPHTFLLKNDAILTGQTCKTYEITVVQPTHGTITVNGQTKSKYTFDSGTEITAILTTLTGYEVVSFIINGQAFDGNHSWQLESNCEITAVTRPISYWVEIIQPSNGQIKVNGSVVASGNYDFGTQLAVEIVVNPGYHMDSFTLDGQEKNSSFNFSVTGNHAINATVTANIYILTVNQPDNGVIKINDQVGSSFNLAYGTSVKAELIPDTGYNVTTLIVAGIQKVNPHSWIFTGDTVVSGTTTVQSYLFSVIQPANAQIKVNGQAVTSTYISYGTNVTVELVPNTGYKISTFTVEGVSRTSPYSFTMTKAASADGSVTMQTFTVTVTQPANGSISVNGNIGTSFTFNYGTQVTITLSPNTGYNATQLLVAGVARTNPFVWGITSNVVVSGTNTIQTFTMSVAQPAGGTILVNNTAGTSFNFNYGASVTVQLVPATGYNFSSLTVNGAARSNPFAFAITSNSSASGATAIQRFTVTVTQPANGNITVNGSVGNSFTFNYGTAVTIQANANAGYKVTALNVT